MIVITLTLSTFPALTHDCDRGVSDTEALEGPPSAKKTGKKKNSKGKKKARAEEPSPLDLSKTGILGLYGKEYEVSVLRKMLVEHFKLSQKDAAAMCLPFGMDPRPSAFIRQSSCPCPSLEGHSSPDDSSHRFPRGFTFDVQKKYADFR